MFSSPLSSRRFLALALVALATFCSPLLLAWLHYWRYEETLSPAKVVDRLEDTRTAIYRSAIHDNLREISLEIIRRRQPEIVVMGSSLAFDFREQYFTVPFVCAGGAMDSLSDGEAFATRLGQIAKPKIVLFVLDFWWFTADQEQHRTPISGPLDSPLFSWSQLRRPYKEMSKGSLSLVEFLGLAPLSTDSQVHNPCMGLMARREGVGRRGDGSQLNGLVFSPRAHEIYAPIRERLSRAESFVLEPGRFGPDLQIRPERIEKLQRILRVLEANSSTVVLVYPPMAPRIVEAFEQSGRHAYYFELGRKISALGREAYDFHSAREIGALPPEFSDTHHAGNVAYMRLLIEILRRNPHSALSGRIETALVTDWVNRFQGKTVAVLQNDRIPADETDFLDLRRETFPVSEPHKSK
jgi:hypothetical protein